MSSSLSKTPQYLPGDVVGVLLPLPLRGVYDYRVPEGLTACGGDFVLVPIGKREIAGVVWGDGSGELKPGKIRDMIARFDAPSLPIVMRRFIEWVSAYTVHPPGAVLKMTMSAPKALEPPKSVNAYTLRDAPADVRMTPARARVFQVLENSPPRRSPDLAQEAGVSSGVVRDLIKAGALKAVPLAEPGPPEPDWRLEGPDLSPDQGRAAKNLQAKVGEDEFAVSVLDGVPGSGKTEVYFQAVAEALKQGRQVLVLLPEIALGAQWLARFVERFGAEPASWHSDLSPARRRKTWRAVAEGRARVVVGARSALFLPFADLGLIVVDEEHDGAFKQ
ncbi:MAG TPA: DEAD/DEAH box helicase, partial [Rhodospirillales bacterium]|nr:DEAD/DEAH box helicase [Rhodospirillales bacterium]